MLRMDLDFLINMSKTIPFLKHFFTTVQYRNGQTWYLLLRYKIMEKCIRPFQSH